MRVLSNLAQDFSSVIGTSKNFKGSYGLCNLIKLWIESESITRSTKEFNSVIRYNFKNSINVARKREIKQCFYDYPKTNEYRGSNSYLNSLVNLKFSKNIKNQIKPISKIKLASLLSMIHSKTLITNIEQIKLNKHYLSLKYGKLKALEIKEIFSIKHNKTVQYLKLCASNVKQQATFLYIPYDTIELYPTFKSNIVASKTKKKPILNITIQDKINYYAILLENRGLTKKQCLQYIGEAFSILKTNNLARNDAFDSKNKLHMLFKHKYMSYLTMHNKSLLKAKTNKRYSSTTIDYLDYVR